MPSFPPCPRCRTGKHAVPHGQREFFCNRCKGLYDDDPDEGGTYSDFNAAVRIEREERAAERRKQQQHKRRF